MGALLSRTSHVLLGKIVSGSALSAECRQGRHADREPIHAQEALNDVQAQSQFNLSFPAPPNGAPNFDGLFPRVARRLQAHAAPTSEERTGDSDARRA